MALKTEPQPERRVTVASWVPVSLAQELEARAVQGERSISAELRRAVKAYLDVETPMAEEVNR